MAQHEPPEQQRYRQLIPLGYAVVVLIGLQAYLRYEQQSAAAAIVGVVVLAVFLSIGIAAIRGGSSLPWHRRQPH